MQYFIPFSISPPPVLIEPTDRLLLIGSCFTEHIGMRLAKYRWSILENPTGIIFNPNSISKTIKRCVDNQKVEAADLVYNNELWHHWDFHSRFSHVQQEDALKAMNQSIEEGHEFIKKADWIFLTLGSSYQYFYNENEYGVSNCHRFPANQFSKQLLSIEASLDDLKQSIALIQSVNSQAKVILTLSPVRHIKDGVVENSRSKARLVEVIAQLSTLERVYYFPAYELLLDVLRDYRFFDADLVHPNYAATQSVWESFTQHFLSESAQLFLKKMIEMNDAFQHRTRFPETVAHRKFLTTYQQKAIQLQKTYPENDLSPFIAHFTDALA